MYKKHSEKKKLKKTKWTQSEPVASLALFELVCGCCCWCWWWRMKRTKRVILCPLTHSPTPACQATRCLLLEWEKCDTRVTCTSSSWSFFLDITLASPNLTLCLTYSHCLPLAHSLSLSSCTLTGGISISRGTTMKTNAFRTKRAQIWNNFLLVNQTKGHVPPSSTRCTPLYTLPPLPL